ncbi:unnamed protein product, partial [marine sediment metagenome]
MKPITFKGANVVFAENQPEYIPLPAHIVKDGTVISCWGLSLSERIKIFFSGRLWLRILTFNEKLQPQLPEVDHPFILVNDGSY